MLTDIDFGYTAPGTFTITDTLWVDEDMDGVYDWIESGVPNGIRDPNEVGERPIAGVTVNLVNSLGQVVGTATTGANGQFTFSGVPNGNYTIVVTDNGGELAGRERTTPDAVAGQRAVTVAGANLTGAHFGYAQPGLIGDRVWSDTDGDGLQDPGEAGLGGITVELLGPGPDGLLFTADDTNLYCPPPPAGEPCETTTAADGSYEFGDLPPGGWRVRVTDTANLLTGYTQTGDPNVPAGPCGAACDSQGSSTLTMAATDRNLDFGYRNNARPDVSGTVFKDPNRNGVFDAGPPAETGIANVEVALVVAGADGIFGTVDDLVVATTTTAADGTYSFLDVQDGDYRVEVRDGAGVLDGYELTSGRDQIPVTVAGASETGIDFGYTRNTATGTIGDTIFIDVVPPNASGPDGLPGPTEPRIPGVTVRLYIDSDGNGVINVGDELVTTTVTDANGRYQFSGLGANRYLVDVVESTLPDTTADATQDLVETTYQPGLNPSRVINLADGQRYDGADFGYRPRPGTVVLGDFVWYDADPDGAGPATPNGLPDPGERGIPGIDIQLFSGGVTPALLQTIPTGPTGTYFFTGLAAGDYLVSYDQADILALGLNNNPTNLPSGQRTYSLRAEAGDVISTLDYGFTGGTFGSIGDLVWLDADDDGTQDAEELGLADVTVNLLDSGGAIIASTTTTADGSYRFVGLPAGSYRVQVTDLAGVLGGLTLGTGSNPTAPINLAAGQNYSTADFGYVPSGGSGSVGTSIWHDLDFDGVRNLGEPPIQGVTVDIYFDTNGNGVFDPGVDNRIRTVTSDAAGNFELLGLPLGTYFVDVTDTAGVLAGFTKTTGATGLDDNSQADPYTVDLTGVSPNNLTADFGYRDDNTTGALAISGTVFLDADANAVYNAPPGGTELPVQGAEVRLYRIAGGRPQLIGITTAAVDGTYSFGDLPAGSYEVRVDVTSTAADGFLQTTQTTTGGVQPVTLTTTNSAGNNFGFYKPPITTTPVTLSFFETVGDEQFFTARWKTAAEVGHVGFNLWVWRGEGWARLTERLIPGAGLDTLEFHEYELEVPRAGGRTLVLEEIDVNGLSRFHGPYEVGKRYGREELAHERIDWKAISREHAAKEAARQRRHRDALVTTPDGALLMKVETDGIHRVTYEQMAAAGLDLAGEDPSGIAVTWKGNPVPVHVQAGGTFGPGAYLELPAFALDTLYTGTNVYRIALNPANAARVSADAAVPSGSVAADYREVMRRERQLAYSFGSPTADPWYERRIVAFTSPVSATFAFETEGRVSGPVVLHLDFWGVTDWPLSPDHHVVVKVNGFQVGDEVTFDGNDAIAFTAEVPEGYLQAGTNTLEVVVPGDTGADFDLVDVDGFTVEYPRQFIARDGRLDFTAAGGPFEVSGLLDSDVVVYRARGGQVERLTGAVVTGLPGDYRVRFPGLAEEARYFVSTVGAIRVPAVEAARPVADLTGGEAALLIIAHPDFLAGVQPLAQRRQAQGWTVKVVDVEDVYAQFGNDLFDPEAIRRYVDYAVEHLQTSAVLLVGGDTYDYRNYLGYGALSFVPSLYGSTGDVVKHAPADGLLADGDGDLLPDVAIGRFPVRTEADLAALVEKTIDYEEQGARKTLVMAADDYDEPTRFSFMQTSEELLMQVPGDWQVHRAYIDTLALAGARTELLARMNQGAAVTSYMGHSGPTAWSFDGLFSNADAAALTNAGLPTVVLQWGCWTTYYVEPANNTLAHRLLLDADGGAAAVLGATTLTEALSERALSLDMFGQLFRPGATLGYVVLEAKRRLGAGGSPTVLDVLLGWNLLGDPTLTLGVEEVPGGPLLIDGFETGGVGRWSSHRN